MLLVDCGNSRLKWRLGSGVAMQHGVVDYHSMPINDAPFWSLLSPHDSIWIASVAQSDVVTAIHANAQQRGLSTPHVARSQAVQMGLKSGYLEPQKLGVDRWLALLAAWQVCQRDCVVIDAGSALTVDRVNARGQHLGGHIVPGLTLLQDCLLNKTAQVKFSPQHSRSVQPGNTTQTAVSHGGLAMAVGYLRFVLQEAWTPCDVAPAIFLTGGDAALLIPFLPESTTVVPQLVLDGLFHYATDLG